MNWITVWCALFFAMGFFLLIVMGGNGPRIHIGDCPDCGEKFFVLCWHWLGKHRVLFEFTL